LTNQEFDHSIERVKSGDRDGLKDIYEAYLPYIFRIVQEILGNRDNAEDVTADFFIKLWEKADSYRPGSGHRAFLTVMARNMALDFLRKHKREELTDTLQDLGDGEEEQRQPRVKASTGANPVEGEVLSEMSLNAALGSLSEDERKVVTMKVLGEMTFKEIAEILAAPMGTVTWRYQNAIKKLRRCGYE
jgi:RNA polymerase sigma-70 factor (ECF subfamily)